MRLSPKPAKPITLAIGTAIRCTLGAWYTDETGWVEALIKDKDYLVLGTEGPFVTVRDETGQENQFEAKLYFNLKLAFTD